MEFRFMSSMGKVFDLLNRINRLQIPKSDKYTPDSGLNAKVKMNENVTVVLGGKRING